MKQKVTYITLTVKVRYDADTWTSEDDVAIDLSERLFSSNDDYAPEAVEVVYTEQVDTVGGRR
jgi:hypothetical protein